jgi:hypothetical protein
MARLGDRRDAGGIVEGVERSQRAPSLGADAPRAFPASGELPLASVYVVALPGFGVADGGPSVARLRGGLARLGDRRDAGGIVEGVERSQRAPSLGADAPRAFPASGELPLASMYVVALPGFGAADGGPSVA